MYGVEASPCHLHCLGKIIQIYFFHWACHTPQTMSVPVVFAVAQAVCKAGDQFPTVRSDAWGGSIPLPSSLFGHDNPDLFFFTGLVIRPKQRLCLLCLQSHRPSVKQGINSPLFVLMHGVEASPCHLHCLGTIIQIHMSACIGSSPR